MAEIAGQAVKLSDLPSPIATSVAPVDVLEGAQILPNNLSSTSISDLVDVMNGRQPRVASYDSGYEDGELIGFGSPREKTMGTIVPGETDVDKRTIGFHIYTVTGLPASGILGQGPVCAPSGSQIQTNRDLVGYVNATGTFTHISDGQYCYTLSSAEIAALGGEGNIWLRITVPGFRTAVFRIPLRVADPSANEIRDAILNAARTGHVTAGTIGEGVAVATSMLHGNFYMDQVIDGSNGQTDSRIRCFHTGAAAGAATPGGSGEGEFAVFLVTTTYSGKSKIATHRVMKQ